MQGLKFLEIKSGKEFKASEIKKGVGLPDLAKSGISFKKDIKLTPSLTINIADIGFKIAKQVFKQSQGIGY